MRPADPRSDSRPRAVVVGCGVVGLTTGLHLLDAGWDVELWGDRAPTETTSAVAAAIWFPYLVAPADRVAAWGARSYAALAALVESGRGEAAGVRMIDGRVLGQSAPGAEVASQLPGGCWGAHDSDEWRLRVPAIDMSLYLPWLTREVAERGGRLVRRSVAALADAAAGNVAAVANCTGLGARFLCADDALTPVRGQVVRVRNPGIDTFLLDERDPAVPTYVVPRVHDCVLGGTAEPGVWDERPDPRVAADILARCRAVEPRLEGAEVLEIRAGLRPARTTVRLERDFLTTARGDVPLVHNYGHGGAGVTLAWGCAEEVVSLLGATAGTHQGRDRS